MPFLKQWIPKWLYARIHALMYDRWIHQLPDRQYLEQEILPHLAATNPSRVMFVGCESYTRGYGDIFIRSHIEYWTCDINPKASVFGAGKNHITCDVQMLHTHFDEHYFDIVLLNGVFGYGVNDRTAMENTVSSIHRILQTNGILLIGWNQELVTDPTKLNSINQSYIHQGPSLLENRRVFKINQDHTHIFDFFMAS